MLPIALAILAGFAQDTPAASEMDRGIALYQARDYGQAAATLEAALNGEGVSAARAPEAIRTLGQSYFMLSQAPKAIPWLEKAPPSNEAYYMLGYAYLQVNQPDKSRGAFARLFGIAPESAAGHLMAAQMMLKKDYDAPAAKELSAALALDPKLPEAHFLLAEIALFRGRVEEGIAELRQELQINPNLAKAWYRLGEAMTRQERWDEAIPNLQRAVWLNPEYSGPYVVLGKCYFKKADWVNAEGILRRAVAIDPANHQGNYYLGQTLIREGKKEEGQAFLNRVRGAARAEER